MKKDCNSILFDKLFKVSKKYKDRYTSFNKIGVIILYGGEFSNNGKISRVLLSAEEGMFIFPRAKVSSEKYDVVKQRLNKVLEVLHLLDKKLTKILSFIYKKTKFYVFIQDSKKMSETTVSKYFKTCDFLKYVKNDQLKLHPLIKKMLLSVTEDITDILEAEMGMENIVTPFLPQNPLLPTVISTPPPFLVRNIYSDQNNIAARQLILPYLISNVYQQTQQQNQQQNQQQFPVLQQPNISVLNHENVQNLLALS